MRRSLWLLVLLLSSAFSGQSAGLIIVHDPDFWRPPPDNVPAHTLPIPRPHPTPPEHWYHPPQPVWAPLEVAFVQASASIKEQIATTKIEEEFYNPNPRQLEGTFLFPVPKGAHINKFTMEINGKPVEAELLEAGKARTLYEDVVRKLSDPALLEYAGRDLFKVRIFPIEPNAKKRVTLSYSQVLKSDAGLVNFMLPLNTEKFSAKPLRNVSVKIELDSKHPLKSIYSPSHQVEIKRDGPNRAVIGYEASNLKPDSDFQLFYTLEDSDLGLNLMTFKTAGEEGYFVLLASPGAGFKSGKVMAKDVAFVLDTSGSMAGAKLAQAKKALQFCVENLNESDRFEILRFSTEVEPLFDKLAAASDENRARAQTFIKELKPTGGTAIDEALRKSLSLRPEKGDRPYVIVFLTDGLPTVGRTDENQILDGVTKANTSNTRIFCFGIGTDVNTHLLDRLTEETRAFSQYVLPEEDIEIKVSNFFAKIKEPVLASPQLHFPESAHVTKLYPSPIPDLFKGEQLVVAGRYAGKGEGAIEIEGTVNGETKRFSYKSRFPDEAADHEFIPRLWATRRVGYLLDEIRLRGENKELKDEVSELARKYSIVTPYTAYLIMEDERQRGVAQNVRSLPVPAGSSDGLAYFADSYESLRKDKSGDLGVGGARSLQTLKAAETAEGAITAGRQHFYRAQVMPAAPHSSASGPRVYNAPAQLAEKPALALDREEQQARQSQFVAGKSFFQNGEQWIDSEVQKLPKAKKVRVRFNSPEYFELLKKDAKAQAWLSQGRQVQFVSNGTVYEIYE
jgi:Ca-activated chloride channel family protein